MKPLNGDYFCRSEGAFLCEDSLDLRGGLKMDKHGMLTVSFVSLLLFSFLVSISGVSAQEDFISAKDALKFEGQKKTVCGDVVSATYAMRSKGQPTFLNLDQPYPNQIFTVVIWGSDRKKFKGVPEVLFKDKSICVTGVIKIFHGKPEIIVHDPNQITIK